MNYRYILLLVIVAIVAMSTLTGCESRAFYGWEAKMFYPNKTWDKELGDPRRDMYQPAAVEQKLTPAQVEEYKDYIDGRHVSQRPVAEAPRERRKSFPTLGD